jgi:hypothetical protein
MRSYPTVSTKIPPDLHEWLKQQAIENSRSVAKQLAWMLSQMKAKAAYERQSRTAALEACHI